MSGIYIHIPFCKQACSYCNFYFSTSLRYKSDLLKSLVLELKMRADYLHEPIQTIYFGGGTPSLLEIEEIEYILKDISLFYDASQVKEITIEVNPNDINLEILKKYRDIGINRLSIGIQSFYDKDLTFLNRSHNGNQAKQCIQMVKEVGFDNYSVDLIYGIPNATDQQWEQNIVTVLEFDIPHISCYCLTVEDKTALKSMIEKGKVPNICEESGARQFEMLMKYAEKYHYQHYEISNFCKEFLFSQHNKSYWQASHYLGIGPSAHSFNGISRQWNVANNKKYITSISTGIIPAEIEILNQEQQMSEYILTSLRTMWGCDLNWLDQNFGCRSLVEEKAQKYIQQNMIIQKDNTLILSNYGKMLADYIILNLI